MLKVLVLKNMNSQKVRALQLGIFLSGLIAIPIPELVQKGPERWLQNHQYRQISCILALTV